MPGPSHQPGDHHRCQAFQIEQQRTRGGGSVGQTDHQKDWTDYSTGEHDAGEPEQIRGAERSLVR